MVEDVVEEEAPVVEEAPAAEEVAEEAKTNAGSDRNG